ncbi:MAG: hypothetical protein V4590_14985 [Bacteroidota bacterium]
MRFPVLKLITLVCFGYSSFILNSCCSDDKNCAAGSPSMGQLPYSLNERLVFKDSHGKTIYIQLSGTYDTSPSYKIDGSCSTPRKEVNCSAKLSLLSSSIIDSNNFIPANQRAFAVSVERHDNTNQQVTHYSLSAFGTAFLFGPYQNGNITLIEGTLINQYQTPSKVYPVAYSVVTNNGFGIHKSVSSPEGRLISFTLQSDTAHIFYIVE